VRDLIGAPGSSRAGVLGPAEHSGFEEGAIDDQLTGALEQSSRLACPWVRRTRTSSPTAIHGIRRRSAATASRERVKAFSSTEELLGAQPATSAATRPAVFSFRLSGSPFSGLACCHIISLCFPVAN